MSQLRQTRFGASSRLRGGLRCLFFIDCCAGYGHRIAFLIVKVCTFIAGRDSRCADGCLAFEQGAIPRRLLAPTIDPVLF